MSSSFIDAKVPSKKERDEQERLEQELYIVPLDNYKDDEVEIDEGEITKEGDTFYSMSLSMNEKRDSSDDVDKNKKSSTIDKIQTGLDIAGFIPCLGAVPDIANGIIYLCRGDYVNMSMSFVAAIPGYGDAVAGVAKGAKYAAKGAKYVKTSKLARIESNHVTEQAMFIIRMAKGQQTKNVSLLWTNGTKMNANKVLEKVQAIAPELKIRMLETTSRGMKMESIVNKELVKFAREETKMTQHEIRKALNEGTLWKKLEANSKFNTELKPRLQKFQADVSKNYAKKSSDDVIVEFYDKSMGQLKNSQRSLFPGQANKAEINLLRKLRKGQGKRSIDGIIGVDPIK